MAPAFKIRRPNPSAPPDFSASYRLFLRLRRRQGRTHRAMGWGRPEGGSPVDRRQRKYPVDPARALLRAEGTLGVRPSEGAEPSSLFKLRHPPPTSHNQVG